MNIKKAKTGKWFEDQYNLKDLLALSVAVNRINDGYIKKDANIEIDDNDVQVKLPNLFIINNHLKIEKFKTTAIKNTLETYYDDVEVLESDSEDVDHMIRYFKGLSLKAIKRNISDFEKNILSIIKKDYVQYKDIGIIASLPSVFANGQKQRAFNKYEKQLAKSSNHVGTLHERDSFEVEIIHKKYIWRSSSYLYVAKEDNTNLVKFFSSLGDVNVGDTIKITAYVKDHTKGKISGGNETYFNRVKIS
tara:strand:- start:7258 stop:8001 length:744 start_codon:yes stop_codon:yes gene_type:complete